MARENRTGFGKVRRAGYFAMRILVAGIWTLLDFLGVIDLAGLGQGAVERWRMLADEKGSHHA